MAKQYEERFILVHENKIRGSSFAAIIVDKMTGVQYLSSTTAVGIGLTTLLDQDGKPLLYQSPK